VRIYTQNYSQRLYSSSGACFYSNYLHVLYYSERDLYADVIRRNEVNEIFKDYGV